MLKLDFQYYICCVRGFNYKKSVQALNHFAAMDGGHLNKMKSIKLIWLADRLHLRKYGRDIYFALPRGPVASTTRDLLERYHQLSKLELNYFDEFLELPEFDRYGYRSIKSPDYNVFSKSDIDILNTIWRRYFDLDQFQLEEYSHQFPEWKKYEHAFANKDISRVQMDFDDFFIDFNEESGLFIEDDETLQIIKEMYHEDMAHTNLC
jgi:hypothetical protein